MKLITILMLVIITTSNAAIHQVGSTKTYVSPNALFQEGIVQDGDTIEIDAELYSGTPSLAVWQSLDLLIRGVGGRPHMKVDDEYIWGKGIWVLAGNNITVENIEFSGAKVPDQNGAGIRLDGIGLTVRHCYFHNNENGILTSNPYDGDILIEYSEFDNNGAGDGFSHNLYIGHVNKLTFQFNYSHHGYIGHNLKSRAEENYILYNRIMDEDTGESSRLIDLSNGGFSIILGNLLMQGNNAQNNNLVGYGREGLTNSHNELYYINNTAVNKRQASCIFLDIQEGTSIASVANNIFAGSGTLINGTTTSMSNNVSDENIDNLLFIDELNYDYNFETTSPAVDAGTMVDSINGISLIPEFIYVHPTSSASRIIVESIDAGAIEADVLHSIDSEGKKTNYIVFPNPFRDVIELKNVAIKSSEISIINLSGEDMNTLISVHSQNKKITIEASNLISGIYILKVGEKEKIIYKL